LASLKKEEPLKIGWVLFERWGVRLQTRKEKGSVLAGFRDHQYGRSRSGILGGSEVIETTFSIRRRRKSFTPADEKKRETEYSAMEDIEQRRDWGKKEKERREIRGQNVGKKVGEVYPDWVEEEERAYHVAGPILSDFKKN